MLDTPEMRRVRETQRHISTVSRELVVKYIFVCMCLSVGMFTMCVQCLQKPEEHQSSWDWSYICLWSALCAGNWTQAPRENNTHSYLLCPLSSRKNSFWLVGQPAGTCPEIGYPIICSSSKFTFQVKYHEDFEKHKGCFTPVVTDPITERVKKNTQDFSDINYRGIQRKVVEMEQKRNDQDQDTITGNGQQRDSYTKWKTEGADLWKKVPLASLQSWSLTGIFCQLCSEPR